MKKSRIIINHIVSRFLDPNQKYLPEDFKNLAEILALPINALRNISTEEADVYQELFQITTIKELSKLNPDTALHNLIPVRKGRSFNEQIANTEKIILDAKAKLGDMKKFRETILIAEMIAKAWEKREAYLVKKETKIIAVGLGNAGKTAIISSIGGRLGLESLANLKPTKKVDRQNIETPQLDLYIWDFGGQEEYRSIYIEEPEKYFVGTDLVLYVIDTQDTESYAESLGYFHQILEFMERLGENPYIMVFLHKADPDISRDPEFRLNLEYLEDRVKTLIGNFRYDFDVYFTSIFNFFTSEPRFAKYIKDVLKEEYSLNDPIFTRVEGLGNILQKQMETIVNLASSVGEQISDIHLDFLKMNERLENIEEILMKAGFMRRPLELPKTYHEKVQDKTVKLSQSPSFVRPSNEKTILSQVAKVNLLKNLPENASAERREALEKLEQTRVTLLQQLRQIIKTRNKDLD